ncbi:winged helix-turn-helix transcriptional regulator, partial [Mesorhizobium sp. M7A.F.Ca.CA.004.05.1.1]
MLDDLDRNLLEILVKDARTSLKELAAQVGLSSPSVSERLRRLEERGVIRAFTVEIDPL